MTRKLKLPIQVQLDVCEFAQAADALQKMGIICHSKSQVLEWTWDFFMVNAGKKGILFDELRALDYLSQVGLPVTVDNKRHKKNLDIFTRETRANGFIVPSGTDKNRSIVSQQVVFDQEVQRIASEIDANFGIGTGTKTGSKITQSAPKVSDEHSRQHQKKSLGLTGAVVCGEDQVMYEKYVKECEANGKIPAAIEDFITGNIPLL